MRIKEIVCSRNIDLGKSVTMRIEVKADVWEGGNPVHVWVELAEFVELVAQNELDLVEEN
jgi:hypothetical protein